MINQNYVPYKLRTTELKGTVTSEGFVPHKEHPQGFEMPVKVELIKSLPPYTNPKPVKDHNGNYVYALPGGQAYYQ